MPNETAPSYQPEQARKEFQAERAHKDYQASIESGRAAAQAAILISGGAATAILAFLSKQTAPPPEVVKGASWSLLSYTVGVAFGALSMWSSAYSSGYFGNSWEKVFFQGTQDQKIQKRAEAWQSVHRAFTWLSFLSFMLASWLIATAFLNYGIK